MTRLIPRIGALVQTGYPKGSLHVSRVGDRLTNILAFIIGYKGFCLADLNGMGIPPQSSNLMMPSVFRQF